MKPDRQATIKINLIDDEDQKAESIDKFFASSVGHLAAQISLLNGINNMQCQLTMSAVRFGSSGCCVLH